MYFKSKPKRTIADRGSSFKSTKFKDFLNNLDVEHTLVASSTPHFNGQVKRINRTWTPMLSKLSPTINKWDTVLSDIEYSLNNTVNRDTGETPAKLLFGVSQNLYITKECFRLNLEMQDHAERNLAEIRKQAVSKMNKVNEYNINYYNKKHKIPHQYKKGNLVMIKNIDVKKKHQVLTKKYYQNIKARTLFKMY